MRNCSPIQKKKLLFIESGIGGGGSWHSLDKIVCENDFKDYDITILVLVVNQFFSKWINQSIKVILLDSPNFLGKSKFHRKVINKIMKHISKSNNPILSYIYFYKLLYSKEIAQVTSILAADYYDLIITNTNPTRDFFSILAAIETMNFGRLVSHIRSNRSDNIPKEVLRILNSKVNSFICNSSYTKLHWGMLGLNETLMRVHYDIILDNSNIQYKNKKNVSRRINVTTIANFSEAKGYSFLVDVVAKISKITDLISFNFVGDGPLRPEIEKKVADLSINNLVSFHGYVSDVNDFYQKADIIIVPSKSEALGRTIIEAFFYGKPVIATRIGGIPELVQDNVNGFLVEYGDVNALSNSILKLSKDAILRENISLNARGFADKVFNKSKLINELKKEYSI